MSQAEGSSITKQDSNFQIATNPSEFISCYGKINQQPYQLLWLSKKQQIEMIVDGKYHHFPVNKPTTFLVNNKITNYPVGLALCLEQQNQYMGCLSHDYTGETIYLKKMNDAELKVAVISSLYAFKIVGDYL